MTRITVDEWEHIPAGTKVANGYSNGYCTAPQEEGLYLPTNWFMKTATLMQDGNGRRR